MSNEKLKSENYNSLGGINIKLSPYLNSNVEFLDIKNFDFQTVGSLTSRWGSTQYFGQTFPGAVVTLAEYTKLSGASYVITSHTGGLWYGATTGTNSGVSFLLYPTVSSSLYFTYDGLRGSTDNQVIQRPNLRYKGDSTLPAVNPQVPITISDINIGDGKSDSLTFVDNFFLTDSSKFLRFNGTDWNKVQLTPVLNFTDVVTFPAGASYIAIPNSTYGLFSFYASYVNDRGQEGPIWPIYFYESVAGVTVGNRGIPVASFGYSLTQVQASILVPKGFGISSINVYQYYTPTLTSYTTGVIPLNDSINYWNPNYVFSRSVPVAAATLTTFFLGTGASGMNSLLNNIGTIGGPSQQEPLGWSLIINGASSYVGVDKNFYAAAASITSMIWPNYFPNYIEVYKERMFLSGYAQNPSQVYFSEVGNPEDLNEVDNFEVRTNDGDIITAMKSYGTRLYIFKRRSFYALNGDGPTNYFLQELSLEYGCLNNACVAVFDDTICFLDQSGLMSFNGSSLNELSDKVQPYFDRMNYQAALTEAKVHHDKVRNQLIVAIPIDGSAIVNKILVYDYKTGGWTTHTGYDPRVLASIQGRNDNRYLFYGSSAGRVNWFGPSFYTDNNRGITLYFKPRFLKDMGESVEKQFRRLYINAEATGTTAMMPVNFFADYGATSVLSTTFVLGQFQNRMEFGIPAKSLTFELYHLNLTSPVQIFGFTVESRMQRRV